MLLFHLEALEKEDLAAKDRIELIGRLLPFAVNKIVAEKEDKLPKRQSDPFRGNILMTLYDEFINDVLKDKKIKGITIMYS
ncbi:MAG: hypothetical protein IPG18_01030 [Saprospiraceae bacterium]|nr:hypothetical protein [Saprospiraceae bacterium]